MEAGFTLRVCLIACMSSFASSSKADSIRLISQNSGHYAYAIQLDPNHGVVFTVGDQVTLSGVSGVTGAVLLSGLAPLFEKPIVGPTSVTTVDVTPIVFDPVLTGVTIPAFSITSLVLTIGPVEYQIQTRNEGMLSGVVQGPVAVPEPGGLVVVLIGIALLPALRWFRCSSTQ